MGKSIMETVLALVMLASVISIVLSFVGLFSEKVRSAVGFGTVKRTHLILVASVLVLFAGAGYLGQKAEEEKEAANAAEGG